MVAGGFTPYYHIYDHKTQNQLEWFDYERDLELTDTTTKIFMAGFVLWSLIMFGGEFLLPIPTKFGNKMNDKDKVMYRLRLANILHGIIAFVSSVYWFVYLRDLTDGKNNSVFEILMMSFTINHIFSKLIFLQFHGLL